MLAVSQSVSEQWRETAVKDAKLARKGTVSSIFLLHIQWIYFQMALNSRTVTKISHRVKQKKKGTLARRLLFKFS